MFSWVSGCVALAKSCQLLLQLKRQCAMLLRVTLQGVRPWGVTTARENADESIKLGRIAFNVPSHEQPEVERNDIDLMENELACCTNPIMIWAQRCKAVLKHRQAAHPP